MSDSSLARPIPMTAALGPSHRLSIDPAGSICTFTVGCHYYGSLLCGNSQYKVLCVRRTAKSVWLALYDPPLHFCEERNRSRVPMTAGSREYPRGARYSLPRRTAIRWHEGSEYTKHGVWSISARGYDDSDSPNSH